MFILYIYRQLPSHVLLFVTPGTEACQAPLSMEFSRQEYWSGLHFLFQGIFWTQRSKLQTLHWQVCHLGSQYLDQGVEYSRCSEIVGEMNQCSSYVDCFNYLSNRSVLGPWVNSFSFSFIHLLGRGWELFSSKD